jgi:carbamoyltransferase
MKTLGISYGYHDAAAALVIDGKLVACSQEDRFTRQKHDANFPRYAVEYCLEQSNISLSDLDLVVYHENPVEKFTRVLTSSFYSYPYSFSEFKNSMKSWLTQKLWVNNRLSKEFKVSPFKIKNLDHHFSHAANAFIGSGFDEAGIIIVDAVGDWFSTVIYKGTWQEGKPKIEAVRKIKFPNSLGLFYSAVTEYLGFNPNDQECNTMALAAFGEPTFYDELEKLVTWNEDCSYTLDQSFFNFMKFYDGGINEKFIEKFGSAAKKNIFNNCDCFDPNFKLEETTKHYTDMAASIQRLYEKYITTCARYILKEHSTNICFAGGGALNCVANGKLAQLEGITNLYIPADPGDGGSAVGAALYGNFIAGFSEKDVSRLKYPVYLGKGYDEKVDVASLQEINPKELKRYLKNSKYANLNSFIVLEFTDSKQMIDKVSELLMDKNIVGWYQGRSEIGPRALGNRSILIRPDDYQLAKRLSTKVKKRAAFRPYAVSVSSNDAAKLIDEHFIKYDGLKKMQIATPVKDECLEKVKACVHVDKSTRPQICYEKENPLYHELLNKFGERFGLSALLNTSFNEKGFPLIDSPLLALIMFVRTEMDVLVLNNTVILKE